MSKYQTASQRKASKKKDVFHKRLDAFHSQLSVATAGDWLQDPWDESWLKIPCGVTGAELLIDEMNGVNLWAICQPTPQFMTNEDWLKSICMPDDWKEWDIRFGPLSKWVRYTYKDA